MTLKGHRARRTYIHGMRRPWNDLQQVYTACKRDPGEMDVRQAVAFRYGAISPDNFILIL